MLRALVTGGFLVIAVLVIWLAFVVGPETSTGNLFTNLGTEIIGIVITVAFVEWLFERRRLQTRGRQLAWDALHTVEHAVWIWQGGPRQMDTDEILGILDSVGDDDPLPDFTEGMFLGIGTRSRRLLDNDPQAVSAIPGFMNGLEQLARLSAIRDGKASMPARKIADILEDGTRELARALGRPTERHLASLIRYRDPSEQSQERRHSGGRAGSPLAGRPEPFA
ncbi:MAG: hypothetical protein WEA34_09240 [Gemmatimonadota bacterium]